MRWRLAADESQSCLSDDGFSGRRSQPGDGAGKIDTRLCYTGASPCARVDCPFRAYYQRGLSHGRHLFWLNSARPLVISTR